MPNVLGYNRKLATLLRRTGVVEEATFAPLVEKANKEGAYLFNLVINEKILDEPTLLGLISEDSGWPPIDLDKYKIDIDELRALNKGADLLSEEACKQHGALPIALIGEHVTVAVINPYDVVALDNLKLQIGRSVIPVVTCERALLKAIDQCFHAQDRAVEQMMEEMKGLDEGIETIEQKREDEKDDAALEASGDDAPAVKAVKSIISMAIKLGASDIHIEPMEKKVRVRLRIDGVLHEKLELPKKLERAVCSRIKIMTDTMNIAERGKPQDGRIAVTMEGKKCDIRVNSLPLVWGEKICMRILAKGNLRDMKELNLEPQVYDILMRALSAPQGMVLVTGPTGSGKSTTLYSCLKTVMTPEENVNTVEDPVEYEVEGINQCHVNPKRGLTFASALRALLRQDPDTIMIGEIRDQETIEIAVKAALTGHLVLSTLHTNDAPSTITRIIDMGIEPLMVASTVNVVLAQRLGRRLCNNCKADLPREEYPSREQLLHIGFKPEEIEGLKLKKAVGCSLCNNGYKGRFALVECLEMNDRLRKIIIGGGSDLEIRKVALETGMISLRRAGLLNVMRGLTTIEEVLRNTVGDEIDHAPAKPKRDSGAGAESSAGSEDAAA
ncbi:MAG: ATPase, T2SS/T4P/T4SS family [Planctomycetota bacterium]|nr:ATPase, T2SS/T4P/T4SS family [Planctomycetota bacterium]MDW8373145.1 ATPase, T2SS/T4P/T4SS family [Planctomycetota bacterium]